MLVLIPKALLLVAMLVLFYMMLGIF